MLIAFAFFALFPLHFYIIIIIIIIIIICSWAELKFVEKN